MFGSGIERNQLNSQHHPNAYMHIQRTRGGGQDSGVGYEIRHCNALDEPARSYRPSTFRLYPGVALAIASSRNASAGGQTVDLDSRVRQAYHCLTRTVWLVNGLTSCLAGSAPCSAGWRLFVSGAWFLTPLISMQQHQAATGRTTCSGGNWTKGSWCCCNVVDLGGDSAVQAKELVVTKAFSRSRSATRQQVLLVRVAQLASSCMGKNNNRGLAKQGPLCRELSRLLHEHKPFSIRTGTYSPLFTSCS
jgi:hypothetical protein